MSCASEKLNGEKRDVSACRVLYVLYWRCQQKINKKGVIKMFRCSFMNYYCVRSLLEMGYSYYDFVECYVDFDEIVHMFPIGYTWGNMVSFGGNVNMVFLGYSRGHCI